MQINPGFFALKDTEVKGKGINFSEAFNSCAKVVALEMFLAALKSKSFNLWLWQPAAKTRGLVQDQASEAAEVSSKGITWIGA